MNRLVFGKLPRALSPKSNNTHQFGGAGADHGPTQIGVADSNRHTGEKMRLDRIDDRSSQSQLRKSETESETQSLMTPARRAALEALEREFRDLLQGQAAG